ncbi:MAG: hypothetical protein ACFNWZ_00860 [Candidatus Absconditicoccaceae bacterium]
MNKMKDSYEEAKKLLNGENELTYEEKRFIRKINSGEERLDFIKHSEIVKGINAKMRILEDYSKEELEEIKGDLKIIRLDNEGYIDDYEDEIRKLENENDKIEELISRINLMI